MSHTEEQKLQRKKNEVRCCHWLNCSPEQYANITYEYGLRYLRETLDISEENIRFLEDQKLFWAWWKNEWNLRNEREFLPKVETADHKRALYLEIHNPANLTCEIPSVILSESYTELIKAFNFSLKNNTNE